VILSDPAKLTDFDACQQYLSTIIQASVTQAKAECQVSSVHTPGGGGGGPKTGSLVDKLKAGLYTDEQYRSLSKEEKGDRVAKHREEQRKKKSKKQMANRK
jgi:hypothetical protein